MARERTHSIREFILDHVSADGDGIARRVAQAYGISRQAANRHLDGLVDDGWLLESGNTRARRYELRRTSALSKEFRVTPVLNADRVWDDHVAPVLASDPEPLRALCRGAFAEMVRRVLTHAGASWITLTFSTTARYIDISVADDGRGLFADLARRIGSAGPLAVAREIAGRAMLAPEAVPSLRVVLLARDCESIVIRSDGVELARDARMPAWSVAEVALAPGTTVTMRCRREARDTLHTRFPLRPRPGRRSRRGPPADRTSPS